MSIGIFITSILAIAGTTILLVATHLWRERNRGLFSPFTEDMLRPPGYSLRNKIDDLWIDFYGSFTAIVIIAVFWFNSVVHSKSFLAALLPSVVYVIALFFLFRRTLNQLETLQNYRLGLSGEEYVGQELNRLRDQRGQVRFVKLNKQKYCLLYTSPSPRDKRQSRMPSSA